MTRALPALGAVALVLSGCGHNQQAPTEPAKTPDQPVLAGTEPGVTPMAQRVAVIGLLNKRNGIVRNLRMKPGQSARINDAIVRLRACETTAPWESEQLTGAFLQLDVEGRDKLWRRVFSGWVYKQSPSLNVVQHPVYDVWPRSCAMTFPPGPPAPPESPSASNPSSARKSPATGASSRPAQSPSPSAAANAAQ